MDRGVPFSSDLMVVLSGLEARFAVHRWTVGSVPIWPLIRMRWFFAEWARHYASGAPRGSSVALDLARRLCIGPPAALLAQLRDSSRRPRGPARHDLLILSDGVSYAKLGGRWLERFCDPIIRAAADNVAINTAAVRRPDVIRGGSAYLSAHIALLAAAWSLSCWIVPTPWVYPTFTLRVLFGCRRRQRGSS